MLKQASTHQKSFPQNRVSQRTLWKEGSFSSVPRRHQGMKWEYLGIFLFETCWVSNSPYKYSPEQSLLILITSLNNWYWRVEICVFVKVCNVCLDRLSGAALPKYVRSWKKVPLRYVIFRGLWTFASSSLVCND